MKDKSDDAQHEVEVTAVGEPRVLDSVELFAGRNELVIRHRGEQYRLRVTRQNKLILTK